MQELQDAGTTIERQVDRVRSALLSNPQAIVLIVPDEFHRHVAQKAFEKQVRNANAATGTVSALVDAEDELIQRTIAALTSLHAIATNSRPAQHQLDGTPLGLAIEEEQRANGRKQHAGRGGEPKKVGEILDIKWADDVPEPRPKIGDRLRVPSGQTTSIVAVFGYQADLHVGDLVGAFEIEDTAGWRGFVYAHSGEWRLVNARDEYTDRVEPEASAVAELQAEGVSDAEIERLRVAAPELQQEIGNSTGEGHEHLHDTPPEGFNWTAGDLDVGADPAAIPDEVDRHTSMAGDLDEEEQSRANYAGSDDLVSGDEPEQQDVASAEREKAKSGKKSAAKDRTRSTLRKEGKKGSGKKR